MIGLIVARSKNNCIGKNGKIPWKIKGEQKQFKELTTGNVVVMGRNSYDEIGHPLPNRETIVISKSKKYVGRNIHTASMKFICGDPMNPATNKLLGSLYNFCGESTCMITPSFNTTILVPNVIASVWSCVT